MSFNNGTGLTPLDAYFGDTLTVDIGNRCVGINFVNKPTHELDVNGTVSAQHYLGLTWPMVVDRPTHLSQFANDLTLDGMTIDWSAITNKPNLTQVNANWLATSGPAMILNKPTLLSNQVNADWLATSGPAMILNKPIIGGSVSVPDRLSAFSNDLTYFSNLVTFPSGLHAVERSNTGMDVSVTNILTAELSDNVIKPHVLSRNVYLAGSLYNTAREVTPPGSDFGSPIPKVAYTVGPEVIDAEGKIGWDRLKDVPDLMTGTQGTIAAVAGAAGGAATGFLAGIGGLILTRRRGGSGSAVRGEDLVRLSGATQSGGQAGWYADAGRAMLELFRSTGRNGRITGVLGSGSRVSTNPTYITTPGQAFNQ